ncbi:4-hydroxybenzoate octaprenyltransferase [Bartonella sp. DGB1]|uniref:4-hydroxybenzoate octaprenyltransferase n=1 Tax=Bartonella sp. DGB1 TaxID=3239807 RepID=UPI0035232482
MARDTNITPKKSEVKIKDADNSLWYNMNVKRILPFAQLARWERSIGWKLLLIPCIFSLFLYSIDQAQLDPTQIKAKEYLYYLILFTIGAIAARGAGCTYNDLVDQNLDTKVDRTKLRPLPAKQISRLSAWIFLFLQLLVAFLVILQFNNYSFWLALSSVFLVALYPFMKRITYFPQVILGLCFSWGALLGWSVMAGGLSLPPIFVYLANICWVIAYDTIYAYQDIEDDRKVGIYSTALFFEKNSRLAISILYSFTVIFLAMALFYVNAPIIAYIGLIFFASGLVQQIIKLDIANPELCLKLFKDNAKIGFLFAIFLWLSLIYLLVTSYL